MDEIMKQFAHILCTSKDTLEDKYTRLIQLTSGTVVTICERAHAIRWRS